MRAVCRNVACVVSGSFFARRPQPSRGYRTSKAVLSFLSAAAQLCCRLTSHPSGRLRRRLIPALDHRERVHDEMPPLQHVDQLLFEGVEPLRQKQSLSTLRQEHQTYGRVSTCSFVVHSNSRRFPGAKTLARQRRNRRGHRPVATAVLPTPAGGLTFP